MKVNTLEESVVSDIGRAFGEYDYGGEHGLIEAFIAYKRPGEKIKRKAFLPLAGALLGAMKFGELIRFARIMAKGGAGLDKRLDRQKKPYLFVGLVCVRQPYQGRGVHAQGYESGLYRGQPAWRAGNPRDRRKIQMR